MTIALLAGLAAGLCFWTALDFIEERRLGILIRRTTGTPLEASRIFGLGFKIIQHLKLKRRTNAMWKKLPDVFDLLALALSTGQNFEQAFRSVVRFIPSGDLKIELKKSLSFLELGRSRDTLFSDLRERLAGSRADGTFALIRQSLRRGAPLQVILFEQSALLRREQMRELERRAQTVGLKLLFPIMMFIFPAIFLILFGAIYLSYQQNGSLF